MERKTKTASKTGLYTDTLFSVSVQRGLRLAMFLKSVLMLHEDIEFVLFKGTSLDSAVPPSPPHCPGRPRHHPQLEWLVRLGRLGAQGRTLQTPLCDTLYVCAVVDPPGETTGQTKSVLGHRCPKGQVMKATFTKQLDSSNQTTSADASRCPFVSSGAATRTRKPGATASHTLGCPFTPL